MRKKKKKSVRKPKTFKELLGKYLEIKGLDIIIFLTDGDKVELYKNRDLVDDVIITYDKSHEEKRIPLSQIESVDLFAA